jgi:GNAT superfamily N-acetyltransferase
MAQIHKAQIDNCAGLARVQVDSYRTAYAGLLPEDYLARLTYEEQEQDWRDWLATRPDDILHVAESNSGEIMGYALGRPGLSKIAPYDSELLALHVRDISQRHGIGKQLIAAVAKELKRQGCSSLMVWVLEKNPARSFYEHLGGQLIGKQTIVLGPGDAGATEVAYGWSSIDPLCDSWQKNY